MNNNETLVQSLIRDGYLKHEPIIKAFQKVDRKLFLPSEVQDRAYENTALAIGYKQTISQPLVVAFMLELLEPKVGEKILEIGSGSGWKTALLAELVGETGKIVSLERIPELYQMAKEQLQNFGSLEKGNVILAEGDGSLGYPNEMPFDKITAAASAETIPDAWKEQLKIGGRIVAPVKESIVVLEKISKDEFKTKEYFGFNFVPLVRGK
ncbi:MAG TPA: protein-L-isoaspartate O-methyltransferase [Candidatus Paceibacterota bacterium]